MQHTALRPPCKNTYDMYEIHLGHIMFAMVDASMLRYDRLSNTAYCQTMHVLGIQYMIEYVFSLHVRVDIS